jgi:hypothetical protein
MGEGTMLVVSSPGSSATAGVLVGSEVAMAGGGSGVVLFGSVGWLGTAVAVELVSSALSSGGSCRSWPPR